MTIATAAERHVALYTILVDGDEIEEPLARRIQQVRVLNYLRLPDVCTFAATFPTATGGRPEPIDDHPFAIGRGLEIRLGAREELTTSTLFRGDIVSLDVEFGPGSIELLVRGFDRSHALLRSRKVRTFQNQTSSDIVEKIAGEAGLEADSDPSGEPHEFIQQDNETDWDFIWRLAERVGFEFVVEGADAHFRRQRSDDEPITLEWPGSLRSFSPRITAVQQLKEVTLAAHDPATKQPIDVTVTSPRQVAEVGVARQAIQRAFDGASLHIATEPVKSHAEGETLAQALLDKLANGYIAAEGVCDGNPRIRAGEPLRVTGLGERFSGTYRVAAVTHVLRGGGTYETRFATAAEHTLFGALGSAAGVAPFGAQLVLGVVTNNDDPEDLGRVRVRYPSLGADVEGAWARVATPSAGNARGMVMLPVAGEEVLIGFEHDDTTRPYVIGSLFNGVDRPGDDLLQGKDGSLAVLSDHKVHIASNEDMTLRSGGRLAIEVQGDASALGHGAIDVNGQKLSVKSDLEIVIEAGTTLTLKCGGSQVQLSSGGVTVSGPAISLG